MLKLMPLWTLALIVMAGCQNDTGQIEQDLKDLKRDMAELKQSCGRGGAPQAPPGPDRSKTYAVSVDGDPAEGPPDAKVTIVKAYDYACPFCARVRPTMDALRKKYGNDVRIVYKQFVVHPQVATTGALAFCAADKQGKAMEMDKLLWDKSYESHSFDKENCWQGDSCPIVDGYAQELALDLNRFHADMKGACKQQMEKDMRDLRTVGVSATPSFFINGRFLVGAAPLEQFSQLVDEELKKANDRIGQGTPQADYYKQWVLDKGQKTL